MSGRGVMQAGARGGRRQQGLTLVELMVALAISLVLVLAAGVLYINTKSSQKATQERAQVFETAQMAMQILGRELAKAGFYPGVAQEEGTTNGADMRQVMSTYGSVISLITNNAPPAGLVAGVFGCDQGRVADDYANCGDPAANADDSDGLLVSYFTLDSFSLDVGDRGDCTRADVANDTKYNVDARVGSYDVTTGGKTQSVSRGASMGPPPKLPLLVVNRYYLSPLQYVTEGGQTVNTFQLNCKGNGSKSGSNTGNLVAGIERLGLRYGVFGADGSFAPQQFLTAAQVQGLGAVSIDGVTFAGWQRVVAVKVCVMARSFSQTEFPSGGQTTTDCDGQAYTPPQGVVVRKVVQVFGLKNRQSQVAGL